jgi:hypothetical protein
MRMWENCSFLSVAENFVAVGHQPVHLEAFKGVFYSESRRERVCAAVESLKGSSLHALEFAVPVFAGPYPTLWGHNWQSQTLGWSGAETDKAGVWSSLFLDSSQFYVCSFINAVCHACKHAFAYVLSFHAYKHADHLCQHVIARILTFHIYARRIYILECICT